MKETILKHSAGGVIYKNGKVLTIKWLSKDSIEFPKGTIEPNERIEDTAIREVAEETGYKTRIIIPLGNVTFEYDWDDGKHYRKTVEYFLMEPLDDSEPVPNREDSEDFENNWLTFAEAEKMLTFDDGREILARAIENINKF